jgi:predicted NAD/FAD-binding protein
LLEPKTAQARVRGGITLAAQKRDVVENKTMAMISSIVRFVRLNSAKVV